MSVLGVLLQAELFFAHIPTNIGSAVQADK